MILLRSNFVGIRIAEVQETASLLPAIRQKVSRRSIGVFDIILYANVSSYNLDSPIKQFSVKQKLFVLYIEYFFFIKIKVKIGLSNNFFP